MTNATERHPMWDHLTDAEYDRMQQDAAEAQQEVEASNDKLRLEDWAREQGERNAEDGH